MGTISPTLPTIGAPRGSEEADVRSALSAILDLVNGQLDAANLAAGAVTADELAAALAGQLGISTPGVNRRGKSITTAEHSRSNPAFGPLSGVSGVDAADEVRDLALPQDGVIFVLFQGMWKESVLGGASAALFLNNTAVTVAVDGQASPSPAVTALGIGLNRYRPIVSGPSGLTGIANNSTEYTGDVTTGQVVGLAFSGFMAGGLCAITAAAGTYDVSVRWAATSGSVTAKARRLWAMAVSFP